MRMRLSEWARLNYTDDSRPCPATLCAMARRNEIEGAIKLRSGWWVDPPMREELKRAEIDRLRDGNPLIRNVAI